MSDFYAHVYLSPHLDDAVLSCGGLIHQQARAGQLPLIVTLFSGRPPADVELSAFAQSQHERWGTLDDVMAVRWSEDREALAALGADYVRLNYPDCIYRGQARNEEPVWYYASEGAIFGPIHPSEDGLPAELAVVLREMVPLGDIVTLYAPLTVGNHVDHQLTFAAALILRAQGWDLRFYEDYPYVEREGALSAALAARGAEHWQPTLMTLEEINVAAKIDAIACYESQLGVLFGGIEHMSDRVKGYFTRVGGERLWEPDLGHYLSKRPPSLHVSQ